MANRAVKVPPLPLTEADRLRIAEAREILQSYGQYVDVAEMSDVAYEKRVVRMKALDTVAALASDVAGTQLQWIRLAKAFEDYIWEGEADGAV